MKETSIKHSSFKLILDLAKMNDFNDYSEKEHLKIMKIAEFGCEIL